jgi:hypothetical protein
MKTGMRGCYKKVSPRYLQSYVDECAALRGTTPNGTTSRCLSSF